MAENYQNKTDNELVILSLKNEDYFLYLIERYEKKLLSYILRISSFSKEEAEDILQEVFIKTYRNLNDFDKDLKFSSWIYRITHNQVISHYRKIKARPQSLPLELNEKILEKIPSGLNLEKQVDNQFLGKNIQEVLNKLDIKYKEVLVLKFLEEKSYQEISDILKRPTGTVGTLINRAKKEFKKVAGEQNIKF